MPTIKGPTLREYLWQWFGAARKGAWDTFGSVSTLVGFVLWAWHKFDEVTFRRFSDALRVSPEAAMSDLVWQIPVAVGACVLGYRFIRAPYEIHLATLTTHEEDKQAVQSALIRAESELADRRSRDHGIHMECSQITFKWDSDPELPEGILVALDVERIVNGNTEDAALEIKMSAPVLRPSLGGATLSTSTRALSRSVESVRSTRPQLQPIINIPRKQGVGPGYLLFFFPYEGFKKFPLLPEARRNVTLDEFATIITESELQIEMVDRANKKYIPPVLAPGTLLKRSKRLERERKAASEEGSGVISPE